MPKSGVFFVTPELQQVLDTLPEDQPRSRLEPFRPFILRWRREGRSYERIRQILRDECKVTVAHATLFKFVKLRSRPRKPKHAFEIEPVVTQLMESPSAVVSTLARKPRMSIEERQAQADAIRAQFANKPEPQPKAESKPLFEYDPDKPLTLKAKET